MAQVGILAGQAGQVVIERALGAFFQGVGAGQHAGRLAQFPGVRRGGAPGGLVEQFGTGAQFDGDVLSGLEAFSAKFNEHLRAADFFDAAKYPVATFKSTKVEAAGEGKLRVTGDLTIKDVTKPVVLDVTLNKAADHPMLKTAAIGFDATATISRTEFGVGAYVPNVGDEVTLRITTEGSVPKAK